MLGEARVGSRSRRPRPERTGRAAQPKLSLARLALWWAPSEHDTPVVDPRLVRGRSEGGQPFHLWEALELDASEHRRTEQRLRDARHPPRARSPRSKRPAQPPRRLDRAGDHAIPLAVRGQNTLGPVRRGLQPPGHVHLSHLVQRLRFHPRQHLDLALRRFATYLAEPRSPLGDEVEREPVAARRDGAANRDFYVDS